MLRRWSKQHLLTLGLDALRWQQPDNSMQVFPLKTAGRQLLPDLQDLSAQLYGIAEQLKGQSINIRISQPLVRYQILPWQKNMVRQQDWLALASQHFIDVYGPVAQQWQNQINFQGYGQPVLAMAVDADLLALIDEQAKISQWRLQGVVSELLALADQHRRKLKANDWLLLCHAGDYLLLAERLKHRWQAVHTFTARPMAMTNCVEAMLKQRQQSYESLPALKVWTDTSEKLPPYLAGLELKPLSRASSGPLNKALSENP